jgi:hypothetical protein
MAVNYSINQLEDRFEPQTKGRGLGKNQTAPYVVKALESEDFLRESIASSLNLNIPFFEGDIQKVDFQYFQQGWINTIWKVDAYVENLPNPTSFVMVVSRGKKGRIGGTELTIIDFEGLSAAYQATDDHGISAICTQPYTMLSEIPGRHGTIPGFSTQLLEKKEINAFYLPILIGKSEKHQINAAVHGYFFNSNSEKADAFNDIMRTAANPADMATITKQAKTNPKGAARLLNDRIHSLQYPMELIKSMDLQIVYNLRLMQRLTGCVPRLFSIDAGDFVGSPSLKGNFDPKLITIRGGLQELESVHFKDWLHSLTVDSNPHFAHYEQSHLAQFVIPESLPLFSGEGNDLEHAIKLADRKINAPKIFRRFL